MPSQRIVRYHSDMSGSSTFSRQSEHSYVSQSTAPTHYDYEMAPWVGGLDANVSPNCSSYDPKASTSTYASTIPSDEDLEDDADFDLYETERDDGRQFAHANATPSTPPEFAELFPSQRTLKIRHDDSTLDGNMNLRIDTTTSAAHGQTKDVTLFHLRLHDLKSRDFSLRRYCRESGREVCNYRKVHKNVVARPGIQRSVSNVIASIRGHKDTRGSVMNHSLKRTDSGYDSFDEPEADRASMTQGKGSTHDAPTNTTKLEFSNYTHIDVKKLGSASSKRYGFEYWGTSYSWKRAVNRNPNDRSQSKTAYHLVNMQTNKAVAHIEPENLSPSDAMDEQAKGGWITPSTMRISDSTILSGLTDVADVIVATGLLALVDDSIARRFHTKRSVQITVPKISPLKLEYVGTKKLIDEVFARRNSNSHSHGRHPPTATWQIYAEA